jgi:hypothetical protein
MGSLTYFAILDALVGHTPGDVAPDAFARAWADSALATVGIAKGAS